MLIDDYAALSTPPPPPPPNRPDDIPSVIRARNRLGRSTNLPAAGWLPRRLPRGASGLGEYGDPVLA